MGEFYDQKNRKLFTRDSIIGLGEESFRKNYYPELQEKISDLEQINARNKALISTIPDFLLVSDLTGSIKPFAITENKRSKRLNTFMENSKVMTILKETVGELREEEQLLTREFQLMEGEEQNFFEARFKKSETNEVLIMIRDMTDRIKLEHRLIQLVERDTLTNLYNRRSFEEKMDYYHGRTMSKFAIISIDIDGLKFINDTLGHVYGDRVIVVAADLILGIFKEYGHVARIGGDEFGVILENIEEHKVEELLEQLHGSVEEYNQKSTQEGLSLAFGYTYHERGEIDVNCMYQEADNNMYQNKLLKKKSIRGTFVKTFMKALEAKDYVSEGHVMRMEKLAVEIGSALCLHQDRMDKLILLTKFHDIGKIGIPDSILKKPAALTEDEWKVMRTHSTIGERIALEAVEIKDIAHLILKHHERWDGKGYPLNLAGEEIPIECRILAIVDTFDAMTNDRPYRPALDSRVAIDEIMNGAGTQFDPQLIVLFQTIAQKERLLENG